MKTLQRVWPDTVEGSILMTELDRVELESLLSAINWIMQFEVAVL